MRLFVMVGAPGAGKGTQAAILARALGVPHVASGELFRGGPPGGEAPGRPGGGGVRRGGGCGGAPPPGGAGAAALDAALARRGAKVTGALYVGVREQELLRRLSGRWLCRAEGHSYHAVDHPPVRPGVCDIDGSELYQRDDDRPATVRARLERQLPPMYEVVDHYTERGILTA